VCLGNEYHANEQLNFSQDKHIEKCLYKTNGECVLDKLVDTGQKLLARTQYLNYGREIIVGWCKKYVDIINPKMVRILDLGCGQAADLLNVKKALSDKDLELFGVECYGPNIEHARQHGILVHQLNIERQSMPYPDSFFDIIIANQIIEHTKEIFWIFSEISRTLKKGGILIVGVPNLLSLHHRAMMFFGQQPISLELLGPHVRGFTVPGFRKFVQADDYFKVIEVRGSGFYPFHPSISKILSQLFPTFSVGLFFLIRRQANEGNFVHVLDTRFYETPYFTG